MIRLHLRTGAGGQGHYSRTALSQGIIERKGVNKITTIGCMPGSTVHMLYETRKSGGQGRVAHPEICRVVSHLRFLELLLEVMLPRHTLQFT